MNYRREFYLLCLNSNANVEDLERFCNQYHDKPLYIHDLLNPVFIDLCWINIISTNYLPKIKWFFSKFYRYSNNLFKHFDFPGQKVLDMFNYNIHDESVCDYLLSILSLKGYNINSIHFQVIWQNNWVSIIKKLVSNQYGFQNPPITDNESQRIVYLSLSCGSMSSLKYLFSLGYEAFIVDEPVVELFKNIFYEGLVEKTDETIRDLIFYIGLVLKLDKRDIAGHLSIFSQVYQRNIPELIDLIFVRENFVENDPIMSQDDLVWAHMTALFNFNNELAEKIAGFIDWNSDIEFVFEYSRLPFRGLHINAVLIFLDNYKNRLKSYDIFRLCQWLYYKEHYVLVEDLIGQRPYLINEHFTMENVMKGLVHFDVEFTKFWKLIDWILAKNPQIDIHQNNYALFRAIRGSDRPEITNFTNWYLVGFIDRFPEYYRQIKTESSIQMGGTNLVYLTANENWEDFQKRLMGFFEKNTIENLDGYECLICNEISIGEIIRTCVKPHFERGHVYCVDCLKTWLREDRVNCPYCREDIV